MSLASVESTGVHVLRANTDWSDVVGNKHMSDNRTTELRDLYPQSRAVLDQILRGFDAMSGQSQDSRNRSRLKMG